MTHKVEVNWKGDMLFESDGPGGKVMVDAGEKVGGQGNGVRPKALMLTALAGCAGMDIASLMKKMRLTVEDVQINVEGDLTEEHPKYYKKVRVEFRFYGTDMNKEKLTKVVNLSIDKYCGVLEMFRRFAEIETEIVFIEND